MDDKYVNESLDEIERNLNDPNRTITMVESVIEFMLTLDNVTDPTEKRINDILKKALTIQDSLKESTPTLIGKASIPLTKENLPKYSINEIIPILLTHPSLSKYTEYDLSEYVKNPSIKEEADFENIIKSLLIDPSSNVSDDYRDIAVFYLEELKKKRLEESIKHLESLMTVAQSDSRRSDRDARFRERAAKEFRDISSEVSKLKRRLDDIRAEVAIDIGKRRESVQHINQPLKDTPTSTPLPSLPIYKPMRPSKDEIETFVREQEQKGYTRQYVSNMLGLNDHDLEHTRNILEKHPPQQLIKPVAELSSAEKTLVDTAKKEDIETFVREQEQKGYTRQYVNKMLELTDDNLEHTRFILENHKLSLKLIKPVAELSSAEKTLVDTAKKEAAKPLSLKERVALKRAEEETVKPLSLKERFALKKAAATQRYGGKRTYKTRKNIKNKRTKKYRKRNICKTRR